MKPRPVTSDCPAALFHPDDLVPKTYPGMRLTTEEAQQVEKILTPHVAQRLAESADVMNGWMLYLHPIPVDPQERQEWERSRDDLTDKRYIVEAERASYRAILKAHGEGDWTALLYTFSVPAWSTQRPSELTKALQPFRDEVDRRRKELRLAAARRLGCSCLDDSQAAGETSV